MKPLLLSLSAILFFSSVSSAQGFHAGLKAGANINKISGQSFKEKFSYGYNAGAFAQIGLGKKWSIQPEVLFNSVNTDTTSQFRDLYKVSSNKISNIKLNYVSIPLLLNYKLSKFISLQAGPQYGILLDRNQNLLENGKDAFKKGELSMLGGLQLSFAGVKVFGRYQVGLNSINDIDNKDKWRNQSIQLGVGFNLF